MNELEVERHLKSLAAEASADPTWLHDLPFRLMEAYQASRNEVAKLRKKHEQVGPVATDVVWPRKMLYRFAAAGQAHVVLGNLAAGLKPSKTAPRFLISSDGVEFAAIDRLTGDGFAGERLDDLPANYDFLQPMFGVERYVPPADQKADVEAARKMRQFYDALIDANEDWCVDGNLRPSRVHDMNLFMTRTLFCLFADRAGIFTDHQFKTILNRVAAQRDGSDTDAIIADVFSALNMKEDDPARAGLPARMQDLRYVNGGLFEDSTDVPRFSGLARRRLLEAADLDWSDINADIFGSMIQAIVNTEDRADFGMHYTSVPNIMKVLGPLFIDGLRDELHAAGEDRRKLNQLILSISRQRVFDPACGSGNFLIIAYRELRRIETEALRRLHSGQRVLEVRTQVRLKNFHGIDPVDFACQTARLSLWISEYQMNRELSDVGLTPPPSLPLVESGTIVTDNALRLDWEQVCPPSSEHSTHIVGNPPYLGRPKRTEEQQEDMEIVFGGGDGTYGNLDYVSAWFAKAADYCASNDAEAAFVATNSAFQGEQVPLLFPLLRSKGVEYGFAHTAFRWSNSAAKNAGVTCVIVGIRPMRKGNAPKMIFSASSQVRASNINPYLTDAPDIFVTRRNAALAAFPPIELGSAAKDAKHLSMTLVAAEALTTAFPDAAKLLRPIVGSDELLKNKPRQCLWIRDEDVELARSIPPIADRMALVAAARRKSKKPSTAASAARAHAFNEIRHREAPLLLIPRISSERRDYIPVAFFERGTVVSDQAFAIYDAPAWMFSVLSSRLHAAWTKTVGGQMETRIRYSNTLVYNSFPMPRLSNEQIDTLERAAMRIIATREEFLADGISLGDLYVAAKMPDHLLQAHLDLDASFEHMYVGRTFRDDRDRLEELFQRYSRSSGANRTRAAA